MSLTPRITLDDSFVKGKRCAICGNPNLTINHVEKYPDFVSCNRCGAAFVVENEGSWVMYGKIPAEYPQTRQFALRQWTWLDAVAQRAADERESGAAPSFAPQASASEIQATPPDVKTGRPALMEEVAPDQKSEALEPSPLKADIRKDELAEDLTSAPPFIEGVAKLLEEDLEPPVLAEHVATTPEKPPGREEILIHMPLESVQETEPKEVDRPDRKEDKPFPEMEGISKEPLDTGVFTAEEEIALQERIAPSQEKREEMQAAVGIEGKPSSVPIGEPEPDKRFRVTIRGSPPKYPQNYCAHCLRTPVKLKAIMRGSLPDPKRPGERKLVRLDLPFCKDCQRRMNARSDEERNARLLSFLLSGLIALIAIVATVVLGIVNLRENLTAGLIILLTVAVLGFSIPLMISLTWASRYPPPRDAAFVLSTLLVNDAGDDLTEFEWRNPGYAELFRQVNQANVIGEVIPIRDPVTFIEVQTRETEKEKGRQPKAKPPKESIHGDAPAPDSH